MKKLSLPARCLFLGLFGIPLAALFGFQTYHREIDRTKEKELNVTVDVSFGDVYVEKGSGNKIVVLDY
ncbi:MAG TPA: hypothetical protein VI758_13380, partial [Bacteroidota bacterium]